MTTRAHNNQAVLIMILLTFVLICGAIIWEGDENPFKDAVIKKDITVSLVHHTSTDNIVTLSGEVILPTGEILKKELGLIQTYTQLKGENTCVIDNLALIIEYETGKVIDKEEVYKAMGKEVGDYWYPGALYFTNKGGYFIEEEGHQDYYELYHRVGIRTALTSNIDEAMLSLRQEKLLLMEVPVSILYPDEEYRDNLFHAITIINIDDGTDTVRYINTISGEIENMLLSTLMYNDTYLKYPARYLYMDNISMDIEEKYFINN